MYLLVYRNLIWSEVGKKPRIMKSELNGRMQDIIIGDDIQHPHSLAIDGPVDKLYWVDSVLDRIESVQLDGSDRKVYCIIGQFLSKIVDYFVEKNI